MLRYKVCQVGTEDIKGTIEVRVEQIGQLFDTLDPFPFRDATSTRMLKNTLSVGRVSFRAISISKSSFTFLKAS